MPVKTTLSVKPTGSAKPTLQRLLRIDREIRSGRHPSGQSLARTLEVSLRTLSRDLEYLRKVAAAPIEYVAERSGYRYRDPAYRFAPPSNDVASGNEIELLLEPGLTSRLLERSPKEFASLLSSFDDRAEVRQIQLRTDGGAELTLASSDLDATLRRVLALGPEAEITGPPAVLRRVRAILKQLVARYEAR